MPFQIIRVMDIQCTGQNSGLLIQADLQFIRGYNMVRRRHIPCNPERQFLPVHLITAPHILQGTFSF